MEKEDDEQSVGQSLEQIKFAASHNSKDSNTKDINDNSAYGSFIADKFKAPVVVEQPKVAVVEVKKAAFEPKPTIGHFREQEIKLS